MLEEEDDEIIDIVGTVFVSDEDSDELLVGIDTDDEQLLLAGGDWDEDRLRDLEGEVVKARGKVFEDDAGTSWFALLTLETDAD
jgi:hypothetical protein